MTLSWIDIAVIGLYLLVMIGIGLWARNKVKNLADYALAGRSLGYIIMIGTLVGGAIGAASTLGKGGRAYETGIIFAVVAFGYIAGLIVFAFFAKKLRQVQIWTIPEVLRIRYGKGLELAFGAAMFISVVALFGAQVIAIGMLFTSVGQSLGLTYTSVIIISGAILIFYTLIGGLLAVAYTDLIQSIIMLISVGIILPIFVIAGPIQQGNFWELLKPDTGNILGGMTPLYIISIFIIDFSFCLIDPSLWQRANAAKDEKVIKNSMLVTAGVYFYWSAVIVIMGVIGVALVPNLVHDFGSTDAIIPVLAVKFLPPGLLGFCFAGLMAVMMSTASVVLLIAGTTVANDIIKPLRPKMSDRGLLFTAMGTVLVVGIISVACALFMKGIFNTLMLAFAVYVSGVFVPVMAACYWDKATRQGAVASSVTATVICVGLYAVKQFVDLPWIEPIVFSLLASIIIMFTVSRATYKPDQATPKLFTSK